MEENRLAMTAHLMRRAGFGATREELETLAERDYEGLVDDLVNPERFPPVDEDVLERYYGWLEGVQGKVWAGVWIYRMVNSQRPLEEKMALFWHHVFATGVSKSDHPPSSIQQIRMFRRLGLGDLRTILLELSKDPAMIFWLDNNENHADDPNENYGRELLELFSMGVGNYTETDVKMAARAFTGWTFDQPLGLYPCGFYPSRFSYREDDHDGSEKTFLGEEGRFDGGEIIDIVVRQPATARFVARHLYNFFVADEAQVPAWDTVPPRDPEAVDTLVKAYFDSDGDMRSVMRTLLNSAVLQGGAIPAGEEPGGAGCWCAEAGGYEPVPGHECDVLSHGHGRDGPAAAEPAHGGGVAHGQGVDRRGHAQRTGEFCGEPGGRHHEAWRPGNH